MKTAMATFTRHSSIKGNCSSDDWAPWMSGSGLQGWQGLIRARQKRTNPCGELIRQWKDALTEEGVRLDPLTLLHWLIFWTRDCSCEWLCCGTWFNSPRRRCLKHMCSRRFEHLGKSQTQTEPKQNKSREETVMKRRYLAEAMGDTCALQL